MIHHLIRQFSTDLRLSTEDLITMHCQIRKIKQTGRKLIISCLTDCNENSTKLSLSIIENLQKSQRCQESYIVNHVSQHDTADYFYIFTT